MRIAVLLLALLLSGCANFQWPDWGRGKAGAPESKQRAPQPAAREQPAAAPAPIEAAQQPAPSGSVAPSPQPTKRKYEED